MPQSLCHGMSEMPSVTPIGLNSASILLFARLVPNSWPAPGIDARSRKRASSMIARRAVGLAVEALHAHEPRARRRRCAPTTNGRRLRSYVGHGAVHVGRDRVHLGLVEQPLDVQEAGGLEEVAHLVGIVVGAERAREIERAAVASSSAIEPGRVDRCAVERGAQHEPPVEEVADVARAAGRARPTAHRLMNVCWSSTRSASCSVASVTLAVGVGAAPRVDRDPAVVGASSVHVVAVDLDRRAGGADERQRGTIASACSSMRAGSSSSKNSSGSRSVRGAVDPACVRRLTWPTTLGRRADPQRRRLARGHDRVGGRDRAAGLARRAGAELARPRAASAVRRTRAGRRGRASRAGRSRSRRGTSVAPRFHFVSISFRIDVWSCTGATRSCFFANGETMTVGTRKP